ncbi:NAD(P)H-binding protein [Burkholderia gladioli]|uniref:NAD(P)H-binding protein n=1 Tax=Burkholderia gladioli TaxID=28095 RepID=UPI001641EC0A|nr:NAD(P)H-binding protein [Burkholderia gladioli]
MSIRSDSGAARPSFAIAGATGRVGAELTRLLAEDPVELLALTRRPEAAVLPAGVRAVGVDFERPAGLPATLQGVERLFIAQGSSPNQVANEIALIDAAVAAGVRHVVKLSAMGPATRLYPMAWHMPIEAHLARQPIASTVLRPSAFTSLLLRAGPLVAAGEWGGAVGSGRTNFVDTRDVAAAARAALFEEVDGESQLVYHLTGPRAWTVDEIARELSGLLDRPVAYAQRSLAEQHALLLAGGLPPFVADLLVGLDRLMRASGIGETTRTVEELTGRPPRSLTDWLRENLDRFRRPAA